MFIKLYRFLSISLMLSCLSIWAQSKTFYASYNGAGVNDMKRTFDNKLILFFDETNYMHRLVKIDTLGTPQWETRIAYDFEQWSSGVIQTTDSCFIALFQTFMGFGTGKPTIVKLDKNGNYLWSKKFYQCFGNYVYDITQTENGGFAVAGAGCPDNFFVIKFDSGGSILWENKYENVSVPHSSPWNIITDKDDGLVITGQSGSLVDKNNQPFLCGIDYNGNVKWYKTYPTPNVIVPSGLLRSADGGYTIIGFNTTNDSNFHQPFLIHADSVGNFVFGKFYTCLLESWTSDILELPDSSYILTGMCHYKDQSNNQMLNIKTDKNGNFIWAHSAGNVIYNSLGSDELYCSERINGTSFYTGGFADGTVIVKNDSSGAGNCSYLSVEYKVIPFLVTQTSPVVLKSDLAFTVDTINITYSKPSYAERILCYTGLGVADKIIDQTKIAIYPNPFSFSTTVSFNNIPKDAVLIMYNQYGQEVERVNSLSSQKINILRNNLPSGIYLICIFKDNVNIISSKLIVSDN